MDEIRAEETRIVFPQLHIVFSHTFTSARKQQKKVFYFFYEANQREKCIVLVIKLDENIEYFSVHL